MFKDHYYLYKGFPGNSAGNESAFNEEEPGLIPVSGRSPGEAISYLLQYWGSLVAQMVKNQPAMWKTWVQSLAQKIPWRKAWQLTSVFLLGKSPWTEEPGGLWSWGLKELDTSKQLSTSI